MLDFLGNFRTNLRNLAKERGFTLAEVARSAGLSPQYLNDILKGRSGGTEQQRRTLSEVVGIPYEKIIQPRDKWGAFASPASQVEVPTLADPARAYLRTLVTELLPETVNLEDIAVYPQGDRHYLVSTRERRLILGNLYCVDVDGQPVCGRAYKSKGAIVLAAEGVGALVSDWDAQVIGRVIMVAVVP